MDESYGSQVRFPVLKSAPVTSANGTLYVHLGGYRHAMQGRDAAAVIHSVFPRIDGFMTREELAADITGQGSPSEGWATQALDRLIEIGMCVVDREQPGDGPLRRHYLTQIAHFGQHVTYPTDCQLRLQQSRVAIIGAEYIGSMLVQHLAAAGIGYLRAVGPSVWSSTEAPFVGHQQHSSDDPARHAPLASRAQTLGFDTTYEGVVAASGTPLDWETTLTGCDLVAVVLPQRLPSLLRAVNQACLARNIPLLPVWIEATGAHIGPLVVPNETPCLLCLALRQGEPFTLEDCRALHHTEPVTLPSWEDSAMLIPWASSVAAIAACEIVAALTQYRQPTSYGQALFVAAQEWRLQVTPVLKIPRCPACSPLRHCPSPQPFALPAQEDTGDGA